MKSTFIWNGASWWLRISTIEEMCDYLNTEWKRRKESSIKDKERVQKKYHSTNYLTGAADVLSSCKLISFEHALDDLGRQLYKDWYKYLYEGKTIYVNGVGGYNFNEDVKKVYRKEGYEFPCFSESDIKIKKWPGGKHFYAYIGDMEVSDGTNIKWNTEKEAREVAKKYITKKVKGDTFI